VAWVAAGPIATLLILAACSVGLARQSRPHTVVAFVGLALGAASRILLVAATTLRETGENDELTVGHLLNISARPIWVAEAFFAAAVIYFVIQRLPQADRWRTVAWTAAGVALGWVSALTFGRHIGLPI
jgi:hypothetical protein